MHDKRDCNEGEIRDVFKAAGWYWQPCTRDQGHDANVYGRGMTFALEVKDGRKPPSARKLTPQEIQFKRSLELRGVRLWILLDAMDALHLVNGEYEKIIERPEYETLPQ